jgi:molybdopterin-guanine dinucleotide biosynthesis protein A
VVVLAGGEAARLAGKLELDAGGLPLVVRTYRNVAAAREVFISSKATFRPDIDALLDAPLVIDRWPRRGPLAGLVATMGHMRSRFVCAVAADAPLVDDALLVTLEGEHREGDEAVVPAHGAGALQRLEPLAALYDRLAFMREGFAALRYGRGGVIDVVGRLRARIVPFDDPHRFGSVNTHSDYLRMRAALDPPRTRA